MYRKKKDPDIILWERIKNGELPYVRVVKDGRRDGRFATYDLKTGRCTYDRQFRTLDTAKYSTLKELIEDPMNAFKMIYISSPTDDSPYWLNSMMVEDEYGYKKTMLKRYFRVAILNLSRSQEEYILHEHKKLMEEKGIKHNEDKEYEQSLLDDTNYRRRLLLTKRKR